ncbi:MAG: helix-hairpin-helix domain-containing protein [Clostridiales bacterium]|nr:helix-hairpin-helix domain-containing protein [Clostridiales bacterium]
MSINIQKFKPFLYPAAFLLIAVFSFAYKTILKGNAGYIARTVRSGSETFVDTTESAPRAADTSKDTVSSKEPPAEPVKTVQVYICGAVKNPGVYSVIAGTILNDVIEKAGGFTADAAVSSLNLVFEIDSNMSFYIPTVKEAQEGKDPGTGVIRGKDSFIWGSGGSDGGTKTAGKVNINTADKTALQTLPGIGAVTAQSIIDYRSKTPFRSTDDLKKVSGIGAAKFERVKDFITV